MDIKNEILWRVYPITFLVIFMGAGIFGKALYIQTYEGEHWAEVREKEQVRKDSTIAERGNIFAEDGSILASSLPYFEIHMDLSPKVISQKLFDAKIDTFAYCLAKYVDNSFTPLEMKERLVAERQKLIDHDPSGTRYLFIQKDLSYTEIEAIKKFPIFNAGRLRGGMIVNRQSKRHHPFKMLAYRTLGYSKGGDKAVGLEGQFNDVLQGKAGLQFLQRIEGDLWIPIEDITQIEPESGKDLVTTIDVEIQDVTQRALLNALKKHDADHGCAVVMEVETGAIRAIANIGKTKKGYWEKYNYAVGESVEPGSTFKLATMMALLEEGSISLEDTIDLEMGKTQFHEEEMLDASYHGLNKTTIQRAFELSSNVGMGKLVNQYFGDIAGGDKLFIDRLKAMNVHLPTGIEIRGEGMPYLKEAGDKEENWSGITLPWMSIGYELEMTPLQLLSLYNAVANDGMMMKPFLVSEIQDFGETIKKFKPTVLNKAIASENTIQLAQELLEGVVERGTARSIKSSDFKIAGKTGTAQVDYRSFDNKKNLKYRSSFVGYFPADNPKYTCIVVVSDPKENGIYGSEVAAPAFKMIAEETFLKKEQLITAINSYKKSSLGNEELPDFEIGMKSDMEKICNYFDLPYADGGGTEWTVVRPDNDTLRFLPRNIKEKKVPNVVGMGLRDAIYILENLGLSVKASGIGKVRTQSILSGTEIVGRGREILLKLH